MPEKIRLKGNKWTQDPRLDRVPRFDPRSRGFAAVDVEISTKKPRSYSWNFRKGNPNIDQLREGGCVGASAGIELSLPPAMVEGLDYAFCRENIYFPAQRSDPWRGGAYPGASPYYEGTAIIDGAKAVRSLGYISGYEWAFGVDDTILTVGYKGPVIAGLRWYDGMSEVDEKGFIRPTGKHRGDHAIVINAVNMKEDFVTLPNSWGNDWGVDGFAKLRLGDLDTLLRQEGEVCLYVGRTKKPRRNR